MAASERVSGYQCQFISEVSDELLCGTCRLVAREPHITSCCGEHFCKNCITQVLDASKPCPSCNEAKFITFLDKGFHKKILALQVCCTMKDRGCEWVGKLEDLQAHLLVDMNDCQYVDIQCPDKCGESVPRHQLPSHLANFCLNRDHFCKYCNFSDTYRVVCYDHWPKCLHYPVQCPNACSVGSVERGDLEDHMKVCLQQEVSCELNHAGCKETFLREDEDRHMKENTQKHLLLMSAMSQRMCREFEQKLQEQREEKERERKCTQQQALEESERRLTQAREEFEKQIRLAKGEFEQKLQEQREEKEREIAGIKHALQQKDDQIQALEKEKDKQIEMLREMSEEQTRALRQELASLQHQLQVQGGLRQTPHHCTPPVCFTVSGYSKLKANGDHWTGHNIYTSKNGYKIRFDVCPSGWGVGAGTHLSVRLCSKVGKFDDQLKWPVKAIVTLQLLNQHRDLDHITKTIECRWEEPSAAVDYIGYWYQFISHAELEHKDKIAFVQYLMNDCLVFRFTGVEIK